MPGICFAGHYGKTGSARKIARLVKVSEKDVQKWIDETLCVTK